MSLDKRIYYDVSFVFNNVWSYRICFSLAHLTLAHT